MLRTYRSRASSASPLLTSNVPVTESPEGAESRPCPGDCSWSATPASTNSPLPPSKPALDAGPHGMAQSTRVRCDSELRW